ncbi:two-component system, chemotaxis family, sensor kinase CheA [Methylobacterium sp. 174MFSha1.1]|uniref:chemotaxis protein CheA n=1 Tax=Methylobacterium sp. 174MFSha1.1 TaxID=1502749 RepID=UPI0008EB7407|nr:chemotaxis protein CheA [Methylobacterium sp. 174MFSha1.1]SFU75358.1 two-component system, chemotaxis family, sensor kinase CheA [Methylobacterium sp. 174MFSha1.1]
MKNALLAQFIPEARECLEIAGSGMLQLERSPDADALNDVFRAVHTLKGTSGLFDVAPLTALVHAAEDLLVEVRTGALALAPEVVDGLLDSLDLVGHWIDALEARERLPEDAEGAMTDRVASLRRWLGGPAPQAAAAAEPSPPPAWLAAWPEEDLRTAYAAGIGPLTAWSYEPDEAGFYRGDDPAHLVSGSPGLVMVRAMPREPFPPVEAFDPFVCLLRFEVVSASSAEALADHLRYVVDQSSVAGIRAEDLIVLGGAQDDSEIFGDFAARAQGLVAAGDRAGLAAAAGALLRIVGPASRQACALRWIAATATSGEAGLLLRLVEAVGGTGPAQGPAPVPADAAGAEAPLAPPPASVLRAAAEEILAAQAELLAVTADAGVAEGRFEAVCLVVERCLPHVDPAWAAQLRRALAEGGHDASRALRLREALAAGAPAPAPRARPATGLPEAGPGDAKPGVADPGESKPAEIRSVGIKPAGSGPAESRPAEDGRGPTRMLRVEQGKVDALMNFVAELTVAKNGLAYLAERVEQVSGSRQLGREIKEQYAVIDRIAQGLQVGVMAIRMMPVSQVFQRFPRLVRDISRKLGKEVALVIQGEDTEADKNVLESLADPLIHMVRNCLDHGIETPEARRAAGKPDHGTLRLTARQENDNVIIEVSDDGRGIDPERVREKALGSGLITPEQAAQMGPEDLVNLVFAAGFSTKEQVSDLSGRGVGMDVVRSAVRKAGGDVWLTSRVGTGTCVTVQLPLTMTVTRIVTVMVRGQHFGVAMESVVETVRVLRSQIHRIKQRETFVLRDAVIPLVRLADSLGLPPADAPPDEEAVLVVRIGRERVGIVVDGFRERMEVIVRPLEGLLAGLPGFSGTALLGDGRVLLILNLPDLV